MDYLSDTQDDDPIPIDDPTLLNSITECSSRYPKHSDSLKNDNYQVLTSDEIVQYVVDYVHEVNNIVQLTSTVTRMLLSHCKWDKIQVTDKFFNDPEKLFKEAHVINPFNISKELIVEETNECQICLVELLSTTIVTNACGHSFCASCWSEYLKVKIMDEGVGNSILCAATDCDVIIDDETVLELVNDLKAKYRYQHLITNSFVQQNLLLRWCPAPGCSYAIKFDFSPFKPMACNCKCGHEFCFDCGDQWHGPVPCELVKRFNGHLNEGLFNQLFIGDMNFGYDSKIKTCPNPNCTVSIQKIYGCPVMQCKSCSTNFCWICMRRFKTRGAVYQHHCKGEPTSEDASNSTQTVATTKQVPSSTKSKKGNENDEREPAPAQKYAKLSMNEPGASSQHADKNESQNAAQNSLRPTYRNPPVTNQPTNLDALGERSKQVEPEQADHSQDEADWHYLANSLGAKYQLMNQPLQTDFKQADESREKKSAGDRLQLNDMPVSLPQKQLEREPNSIFQMMQPRRQMHNFRNIELYRVQQPMVRPRYGANYYYQKYKAEDTNYKTAVAQSVRIKQALEPLDIKSSNMVQLESASILLVQSRQVLKYSAIFVMYLKKVDESLIFENLYRDLENAAQRLSHAMTYVHVNLEDTHEQIPEMIIPAHRNCKLRRCALLDYIDEGYDNEWWIFDNQPT